MTAKYGKQHGAILIITMVILLMLTFYGVVSTRDAKTQLKIVGNTQLYSQALANAEGVLTKAEATVGCMMDTCSGNRNDGDNDAISDCPVSDTIALLGYLNGDVFLGDGLLNSSKSATLSARGCLDGSFLSATDLADNEIIVTYDNGYSFTSDCGETKKNDDGDFIENQLTRVEAFEIKVSSNQNQQARRRVRSVYVSFADEYCP